MYLFQLCQLTLTHGWSLTMLLKWFQQFLGLKCYCVIRLMDCRAWCHHFYCIVWITNLACPIQIVYSAIWQFLDCPRVVLKLLDPSCAIALLGRTLRRVIAGPSEVSEISIASDTSSSITLSSSTSIVSITGSVPMSKQNVCIAMIWPSCCDFEGLDYVDFAFLLVCRGKGSSIGWIGGFKVSLVEQLGAAVCETKMNTWFSNLLEFFVWLHLFSLRCYSVNIT